MGFGKNKVDTGDNDGSGSRLRHLRMARKLKREPVESAPVAPALLVLRRWQSERLARTHADFFKKAEYQPAMEFFLEELYGPKDFSQRDADIERLYPVMEQVLPPKGVETLRMALELNSLSHRLDVELLAALEELRPLSPDLSEDEYAEAYRRCDNYAERRRQIELIRRLGVELQALVQKSRFTATALKLARAPARLAGFGELHRFLERGYAAFSRMHDPAQFVDTVVSREFTILDRIYAGSPEPLRPIFTAED